MLVFRLSFEDRLGSQQLFEEVLVVICQWILVCEKGSEHPGIGTLRHPELLIRIRIERELVRSNFFALIVIILNLLGPEERLEDIQRSASRRFQEIDNRLRAKGSVHMLELAVDILDFGICK